MQVIIFAKVATDWASDVNYHSQEDAEVAQSVEQLIRNQ